MRIDELLREKNHIKYQIKSLRVRIEELNECYIPGPNTDGQITAKNNSSPQEIVLLQTELLLEKIKKLLQREMEIDELIDKELTVVENPNARLIAVQRFNGKAWKEIDVGYSQSYMRKIFRDTINKLKG